MTKRINLISGPRNISTALMYSFGNRSDTTIVDEPMYAYYLQESGVIHPGRDEVLKELPTGLDEILKNYIFNPIDTPLYFIKGMAHHYHDIEDLSFLNALDNVFLIRDPHKLISSFSQVIPNPTMQDIGIKKEWEIHQELIQKGQSAIILDSGEVLKNPKYVLSQLCEKLNIPFSDQMLTWPSGPRPEDGSWARFWYHSVWNSTGFEMQKTSAREFPSRLNDLLEESLIYYQQLFSLSIKSK